MCLVTLQQQVGDSDCVHACVPAEVQLIVNRTNPYRLPQLLARVSDELTALPFEHR
jgi:hypothetical protein